MICTMCNSLIESCLRDSKCMGIGDTRQYTMPIHLESLKQDSIKELHIVHIMQDNPLKGIEHVGIRIKETP